PRSSAASTSTASASGAAPSVVQRSLVSSTGTTVSAPVGIGAPVIIRAACPAPTVKSGCDPAGISPITARRTGRSALAPARSSARTAYPSIAELANAGTSCAACTSSASTRPSARDRSTVSCESGCMSLRMRASTSSTFSKSVTVSPHNTGSARYRAQKSRSCRHDRLLQMLNKVLDPAKQPLPPAVRVRLDPQIEHIRDNRQIVPQARAVDNNPADHRTDDTQHQEAPAPEHNPPLRAFAVRVILIVILVVHRRLRADLLGIDFGRRGILGRGYSGRLVFRRGRRIAARGSELRLLLGGQRRCRRAGHRLRLTSVHPRGEPFIRQRDRFAQADHVIVRQEAGSGQPLPINKRAVR